MTTNAHIRGRSAPPAAAGTTRNADISTPCGKTPQQMSSWAPDETWGFDPKCRRRAANVYTGRPGVMGYGAGAQGLSAGGKKSPRPVGWGEGKSGRERKQNVKKERRSGQSQGRGAAPARPPYRRRGIGTQTAMAHVCPPQPSGTGEGQAAIGSTDAPHSRRQHLAAGFPEHEKSVIPGGRAATAPDGPPSIAAGQPEYTAVQKPAGRPAAPPIRKTTPRRFGEIARQWPRRLQWRVKEKTGVYYDARGGCALCRAAGAGAWAAGASPGNARRPRG